MSGVLLARRAAFGSDTQNQDTKYMSGVNTDGAVVVKELIRRHGATLTGVARYAGVSKGHVSNVLAGRAKSERVIKALSLFSRLPVQDVEYFIENQKSGTNHDHA